MNSGEFWVLEGVTDEAVQRQLAQLLANGARTEARILAHIAAIEERRLHLRSGCSSLFQYCVERLGLSESEAFHRLTAARLARRFPVIFRLIEDRKLHLTGACLLRDYLDADNHLDLLSEACGKTKLQILELLARRHPRPDVASRLRKLPAAAVPTPARAVTPAPGAPLSPPPALAVGSLVPPRTNAVELEVRLEPTSPDRYRLQLNLTAAAREKLELARALLSHSIPNGDLAAVIERALDELLVQLHKKRFGHTAAPRARTPAQRQEARSASSPRHREHITHEARREVTARDGLRCTFESEDGHRCTSLAFLQFHHAEPWARKGGSGTDNLQMLCAAHNRLLAERDFGREKMASVVARKRLPLSIANQAEATQELSATASPKKARPQP